MRFPCYSGRAGSSILAVVIALLFQILLAAPAAAHFGMVIPEYSIVPMTDKTLTLTLSFSHPMEMVGMDMARPKAVTVYHDGQAQELAGSLAETQVMGHKAWTTDYAVGRPGIYAFALEPQPYPEPAEDNYIIHYTKTIVAAFDSGEEWQKPLGLKTEIVPLTRPWGNYAGNVMAAQVLLDGKPVPHALVEVEYYNKNNVYQPPSDAFITQETLADENGVFVFACPWPGWWGFAALSEADYQIDGKAVELGAVLWVEMMDEQRN